MTQARLPRHSESALHPLVHTKPSQISPLRQSSSLLQSALQTPEESQRSLLKQLEFEEHTGRQIFDTQVFPAKQSLLTEQLGPGVLRQATLAVGLGIKPVGHEQLAR